MNALLLNAMARMSVLAAEVMPLAGGTEGTMTGLVKWAGTIAGALIAVFLIYSIAKDAFGYIKGSGDASMFKIITKVIFLMLCVGLIVVAQNYQSWMDSAAALANHGINAIDNAANEILAP